jgi:hypothetical protein
MIGMSYRLYSLTANSYSSVKIKIYFLTLIEHPMALVVAGVGSIFFSNAAMAFSRYFSLTMLASGYPSKG